MASSGAPRLHGKAPALLDVQLASPWLSLQPAPSAVSALARWFSRSFYLDVGHRCNQSCRYCFQDKVGARFLPFKELAGPIAVAGILGFDTSILIGGEPLLHPQLEKVVARLREADVRKWGVMTNGIELAKPGALDRLVEKGLGFCQMSFDSPDASTQNGLARNVRLFDKIQEALTHFSRHPGVLLVLNAVVVRPNVGQLTDLVRHVAALKSRLGIRPFVTLTHAKIHEAMAPEFIVGAGDAAAAITDAVREGRRLALPVLFRNVPFCLMNGLERWSTDWFTRLRGMDSEGRVGDAPGSETLKKGRCRLCVQAETCPGFSAPYVERFGDEEFQPIQHSRRGPGEEDAPVGDMRFPIGETREGVPVYFPARALRDRLPALISGRRLVLIGPEPTLHPELPGLIRDYSSRGFTVYLETTALALAKPQRAEFLRGLGLAGIVWLHPSPESLSRDRAPARALPGNFRRRIEASLRAARLEVDHAFPDDGAPAGFPAGEVANSGGGREGLGEGLTISLLLGTACNFRCEFCYLENHQWTISAEKAFAVVDRLLATGCRRFLLAGGEPTIFPRLADVVERISSAGAETILVSNGLKLAERTFVRTLRDAGLSRVLLSMHSHKPENFARLVHVPASLPVVLDGFHNLLSEGFRVGVHHVFYSGNHADFADFVRFYGARLRRPGLTELSVSNIIMMHPELKGRSDFVPRLSDVRPHLEEGTRLAREMGFEIGRGASEDAFPECVFGSGGGPLERLPQERMIVPPASGEPGIIFAGAIEELPDVRAFGAKDYNGLFVHPPACRFCRRLPFCRGVQSDYLALHGDGEIVPIRT